MHTSLTFTRVKLRKRAKVNSEASHLWYGIFSVDSMQLPVSWAAPASTRALVQKVLRISWDLQKHNLFANNPSNIRDNMKSQIKNKNQSFNCGITNTNIKQN